MNRINQMTELEFSKFFSAVREKILTDPIKYFVEAPGFIDFNPTPAQRVALKCVFGIPLDNTVYHSVYSEKTNESNEFDLDFTEKTEAELFYYMTGFEYSPIDLKKNRINLIIGRRGGKSTISAILALFSTFKVNWMPYLKKTPVATVAILSHSVEFSQEILDIIGSMVDGSEVLTRLRDKKRKNTQSTFHLQIPFLEGSKIVYSRVAIKVGAASKKTTRGRAVCTLLADEVAYWNLSENAAESDIDILRAIRPALLQFGNEGMIIKLSSPAIKQGVLYDEWNRRDALKGDYVQFKAPSWVWNTILPPAEFRKEWRIDQDGFNTEFRANFVDSLSNFISPEFVDMAVVRGVKFFPPSEDKNTIYSAAIDAAFKSDRFAFVLVGYNGKRITTYILKYWEGTRQNPVKAHEVAKYIRTIFAQYGLAEVYGDQYSFQPLREIFEQYGIRLMENTFSITYKKKIYFSLKRLFHSHQIDLPDIPLLSKEIKELQVEQTSTGQIRIGHPQGGTDDTADALAVACQVAITKAGSANIAGGEFALGGDPRVKVDSLGRAFTAPNIELLHKFQGFEDAFDNSSEYVRDPETGKFRHVSEVEDENQLPGSSSGANFIF